MGIPRKFTSQGVTVIPFDMIYDPDAEIPPNNYWYYGQQDMKAVRQVRKIDNLYLSWISNFSCAPDSFMLHYVRWLMGQKPYLVLEIDSHTADAGLDTRVEAFLDIVESYRRHMSPAAEKPFQRRYYVALKEEFCDIVDRKTGKRFDIRDPRVHAILPSMGDLSTEAMNVAALRQGIRSTNLPLPDVYSTQLARNVASGKECIPALLVLGSILQFFRDKNPSSGDDIYLVFVPSTLGPCRTGQYHVFFDRLFDEMGWENVVLLVAALGELVSRAGPDLHPGCLARDRAGRLLHRHPELAPLLARDPDDALALFESVWQDVLRAFQAGPTKSSTGSSDARGGPARPASRCKGEPRGPEEGAHHRRDLRPARQLLGRRGIADAHIEGDLPEGHRRDRVDPLHRLCAQVHHGGPPQARGLAAHPPATAASRTRLST